MQANEAKGNLRAGKLSVTQKQVNDHGYQYSYWLVQGTDTKGNRIRKKFQDEAKARGWKNDKETELLNVTRRTRHVTTTLTLEQLDEAEASFKRLKDRYTLTQVLDYFFAHYQEADFKISVGKAIVEFRGAMERKIRERSLVQLKSTLGQFEKFVENCDLHEINSDIVEQFLRSLRARDGISQAARKTWNNYRADLHLFFEWCTDKQRRWLSSNPAADTSRLQVHKGHAEILALSRACELMDYVASFKEGKYVRYFALGLFAGIRPGGELEKLSLHPELIDLENRVVRITEEISKTGKPRQIQIRPNLYRWLTRFGGDLFPTNCDRELKAIRKKFALSHDILRHTFCSAHVMAFGSFAETAIESGNSEAIIKNHYFNAMPKEQALAFWEITPQDAGSKVIHLAVGSR